MTLRARCILSRTHCVHTAPAPAPALAGVLQLDIVLPPGMPSLQKKAETLDFVERAYVHMDTEFAHKAEEEHIPTWL